MNNNICQKEKNRLRRSPLILWVLAVSFGVPTTFTSPAAVASVADQEAARCRHDDPNCDKGRKDRDNRERDERDKRDRDRENKEREQREREGRDREQRERDQREREGRERDKKEREKKEREQREREGRDREQRERDQREREGRERDQKEREKKEREQREREGRDREQRDRDQREREGRERDQRDREKKEREQREREGRDREQREREQREREGRERDQKEREKKEREQREREGRDREQREREKRDREREQREREARQREGRRDRKEQVDREIRKRERERYQRERAERQRREQEREYRERRDREQARRHKDRDKMRRDWERIERRQSQRRREMRRDHAHWHDRHRHWRDDVYRRRPYRPNPPSYPIIILPDPIYNGDNYWEYEEVAEVAHSIETLTQKIYLMSLDELQENTIWNNDALGALHDLVSAAQLYDDVVDSHWNDFDASIYDLFNLEAALKDAKAFVDCGPLSYRITENFEYVESLVDELLWTYRLYDSSEAVSNWGLSSKGGKPKVPELNSAPVCTTSEFWWSKPHKETQWLVFDKGQVVTANNLKLQVVNTFGQKGTNGVAGVSLVEIRYQDGDVQELVREANFRGHRNVHKNGQLAIKGESDIVHLPYLQEKPIYSIRIVADSWISPDTEVKIKLTLFSTHAGSMNVLGFMN